MLNLNLSAETLQTHSLEPNGSNKTFHTNYTILNTPKELFKQWPKAIWSYLSKPPLESTKLQTAAQAHTGVRKHMAMVGGTEQRAEPFLLKREAEDLFLRLWQSEHLVLNEHITNGTEHCPPPSERSPLGFEHTAGRTESVQCQPDS